jgi:transcription antitermination factor NusG
MKTEPSITGEERWYALVVKPQHEKQVARVLTDKGFEQCLPLYWQRRRWNRTTRNVHLPVFPAYAFCRFSLSHRIPVLQTPGVRRIAGAGCIPIPLDESEIEALKAVARSGLPSGPHPFLATGRRVVLVAGPLAGVSGILERSKGTDRLVVSVQLLQRSLCVEIDRRWVVPERADRGKTVTGLFMGGAIPA